MEATTQESTIEAVELFGATMEAPNVHVFETREEWLAGRDGSIGASEAPAICGESDWQSGIDVWRRKRGEELPTGKMSIPQRKGLMLEPLISSLYSEEGGLGTVFDPGPFTVFGHASVPHMTATPDRILVIDDNEIAPLQLKHTSSYAVEEQWFEGCPKAMQIQVQQEIEVMGAKRGFLACLGDNFQIFEIKADESFMLPYIDYLQEFWRCVESGDMPRVDGSKNCKQALSAIYGREVAEQTVCLDAEFLALDVRRTEIAAQAKQLKPENQEINNTIKAAIGDSEFGELPDGTRFRWGTVERGAYNVEATTYRQLTRRKAKKPGKK